jgi:hypothetical protein
LPDTPPPAPWRGRKNGTGMIIACVQDVLKAPLDVPGWNTTRVTCTDRDVRVSLSRDEGTVLWAEHYLKDNGYPDTDFRNRVGGNSLSITYPTSYVSEYGENLAPQPVEEVVTYLREHFEEMGMDIEAVLQPNNPSNRTSRFFEEGTFKFDTDLNPDEFSSLFSKIRGFVIDSVSLNIGTNTWSVSGTIYHRRPVPLRRPEPQN